MYMVHKFQDRFARQQAVLQNTRDMLKGYMQTQAALFLRNNGANSIDISRDAKAGTLYFQMLPETDVLIDEWVNKHPNPTLDDVCAFASSTVEDFAEEFQERLADMIADRVNGNAS